MGNHNLAGVDQPPRRTPGRLHEIAPVFAADGPSHAVQTAWMVDSPATRAQLAEMIANARAMNAFESTWRIEERAAQP